MKSFKFGSIREYIALLEAEAANPYAANPQQAAIYAAMSPEDKAWATKGGGLPDLTDPMIANRAPNGFKPVAVATPVAQPAPPAAAPAAAPAPTTEPAPAAAPAPTAPAAAPAPAPATPPQWNKGVLGKGSKGPEVSALQKKLGIPETGTYDAATITAVQKLQTQLGVKADGAYGPMTRAAHDKTGQGAKPAVNVAAPGQPAYTAAQPELGTRKGATQAIPTTPVNPANPGGVSSKMTITPDQAQAALDNGSERDIQAFGGRERLQQLAGNARPPAPAAAPAAAPAQPATTGQQAITAVNNASLGQSMAMNPMLAQRAGVPAPAAAPGETAGGAVTSRPVRPATGARADALQRQQAQNQVPESVSYSEDQSLARIIQLSRN